MAASAFVLVFIAVRGVFQVADKPEHSSGACAHVVGKVLSEIEHQMELHVAQDKKSK